MLDLKGYGPDLLSGAIVTMELAFLSLALALILGLLGASAKLSGNRPLRAIATIYTTCIRGVPDIVMMLLFYYGGQLVVNSLSDMLWEAYKIDFFFQFDPFISGVVAIGLIFGAYMTETFRGAFLAVDTGQIEAAQAYGFSRWHTFRRIIFPQMLRHALPGIGNNWQVLLKTTALVSIIGLTDMVRVAEEAAKAERMPFHFFIPVAFVYLALTAVSELFIKWLDVRANVGVVQGS
ncbi:MULTISPECIES: ABC transporter permease [unclassified Marinobacter]|jgi:arginine/ornithine transport system permease protein|uniref:ABC transporter permease n=1 Tax=unclassified Marinobacter TaxID=83889 RepID=UPI00200EAB63|nr:MULTISPECIES: ABC transporter permease [unclassified Marinobacter]MCL1478457.1 ABC transporter permease [Marinobacter sp.]MCL1480415.1 ABC transporter permease [Marinobacter sp.]UQG55392.1 ABC transporter permease [Marinobacter sp. M4C]UQG64196.1 ABC transporter permease [Marinobacter sp. M2C]UQG68475.1 ABC transporter permease [Marinobacter sp. M1C]